MMGFSQEAYPLVSALAVFILAFQGVECSFKRSLPVEKVTECMFMTSEDGYLEVESREQDATCAIYIIKSPDEVVELEVDKMDVSCDNGGLINLIDGWEMNGQFFPSENDHPLPMRRRYKEICGAGSTNNNKPAAAMVTNQNAALVSYRLPTKGDHFRIKVRAVKNSAPCNVLLDSGEGVFMLQNNNGDESNCSVTSIFPADIQVLETDFVAKTRPSSEMSVLSLLSNKPRMARARDNNNNNKHHHAGHHSDNKQGMMMNCGQEGDLLEIKGGSGLDSDSMQPFKTFCSVNSVNGPTGAKAGTYKASVLCGSTTVRLSSSGHSYNTVKFSLKAIPLDNPEQMPTFQGDQFFCPMEF